MKDFVLKFPDIDIPDLDFNSLFDFLAGSLNLPKINEMKIELGNPVEKVLDHAKGLLDMTYEEVKALLKNFTQCDQFKNNVLIPGKDLMNKDIFAIVRVELKK